MDELPLDNEQRLTVAQPTPLELLSSLVRPGNLTPESVSVAKELISLMEHMEDRKAEREFAEAFGRLQGSLKAFTATKAVPDKNGNVRYSYLPYDEIMRKVQPLLEANGFSVSFSTDLKENRIVQTCTLQHVAGHHRDYLAFVRAGAGPYGATETQADGAAMTYAKRYSLCNALNIVVDRDTDGDARNEGSPITEDQALYLRELVRETGSDEGKFLAFAGAKDYEEIGSARYDSCVAALNKKARK
jgi:hypothetical protein